MTSINIALLNELCPFVQSFNIKQTDNLVVKLIKQ